MIEYNLGNILALNEILSAFDEVDSMTVIEYNDLVDKANKWYESLIRSELGKLKILLKKERFLQKISLMK